MSNVYELYLPVFEPHDFIDSVQSHFDGALTNLQGKDKLAEGEWKWSGADEGCVVTLAISLESAGDFESAVEQVAADEGGSLYKQGEGAGSDDSELVFEY